MVMSLHRCAACGSRNVIVDKQNGGVSYNYKKGIAGTIVLGTGGATAGIESKSQEVFKCQDCGMTLTYEMLDDLRTAIDIGVNNEKARSCLKVAGTTFNWNILKERYKNIEEGITDQYIATRQNAQYNGLLYFAKATQEEFDVAIDLIVKYKHRWNIGKSIISLMEYNEWQNSVNIVVENAVKYFPESFRKLDLSLNRPKYREFWCTDLNVIFLEYIYEHYYLEYGHRLKTLFNFFGESYYNDLEEYANNHPIILDFANEFYNQHRDGMGGIKEIYWEPENFAKDFIPYLESINLPAFIANNSMKRCSLKSSDLLEQEVHRSFEFYIPKYRMNNGRIYFGKNLTIKNKLGDLMQEYFSAYPQKQSEFHNRIEMRKKQIEENKAVEQKIENNETTMNDNNSAIINKQQEIDKLRRKIFGKKVAYAKADILEKEICKLREQNNLLSDEINTLEKGNNEIVSTAKFYAVLLEEMDYFTVWQCVDDVE